MRQQRDVGLDAEQFQAVRGLQGGFDHLLHGGVFLHVRIQEEEHALLVDHAGHGRGGTHARFQRNHAARVAQFLVEAPHHARQHRVGFAARHHHCGNQGRPRAHQFLGRGHGRVVVLPVIVEARVVVDVGDLEIFTGTDAQPHALDTRLDDVRAADQDRQRQAFVNDVLHRTQHHFFFAFGIHHALLVGARAVVDRLHHQAGAVDELAEPVAVGRHVGDRARGHARIHRRLRHRRGQLHQQARVQRTRNQVFRAEARGFATIGRAQVGGLAPRHRRNRLDAGDLHVFVDAGGAHVQRAAEQVREAQHVVDLVRVVRTAGADDAIRPHRLGRFRGDFRVGVGQRKDHRLARHGGDHFRLEDAGRRQAQEDVGTFDDFGQGALVGVARVALLVRVQVGAAGVDHAIAVQRQDVLRLQAQRDQHVDAGDAGRAHAGGGQLDVFDLLAGDHQCVEYRRADDDGSAVLVVMEHRDVHALAQLALDDEALRRLDVFQVDAAEGRLQAGDDVHQLVRVVLVDLDVEHVDAGELLEQHALAFHHRLGGQRTDVAQAQHRGAVGDHRHQIAARGELAGLGGVLDDGLAGEGHARRIRQRQIALGQHRLGRGDLDLAGRLLAVIVEGGLFEVVVGHRLCRSQGRRRAEFYPPA